MPDLPIISLSQEHFDRVVAAFPGNTLAEKAAAYYAWTINNLIGFVESVETRKVEEETNLIRAQRLADVTASLPPRLVFPPIPNGS